MAPSLQQPISNWQRVIKDRIVGKVPHRKVVDPAHGARRFYAVPIHMDNRDPAHKHDSTLGHPAQTQSIFSSKLSTIGQRFLFLPRLTP
jgi:hypothetical protein